MHRFNKPNISSAKRGYDAQHRRIREQLRRRHHPSNPCVRCGHPLGEWGPWLHLDHNATRTGYRGMAHAACNVKAGAREGRRRRTLTVTSNIW